MLILTKKNKTDDIMIMWIDNKPLKPSIKFAPLITNKKHNNTNIDENIWLDIKGIKKGISILKIFTGKKYINKKRRSVIIDKRSNGLMFVLKSSKKPTKKTE